MDKGHWATGNAYSIRKVFELQPMEAYWLDSCVACIASYTVQSGQALGYVSHMEKAHWIDCIA